MHYNSQVQCLFWRGKKWLLLKKPPILHEHLLFDYKSSNKEYYQYSFNKETYILMYRVQTHIQK